MALIWNADIFKRAGLDPDKAPATWDDVVAYSKQIHDKLGIAGYGLVGEPEKTGSPRWSRTTKLAVSFAGILIIFGLIIKLQDYLRLISPTTSGACGLTRAGGICTPGTSGTLAALMPREARYMQVGVLVARDTPRMITSASVRSSLATPSSWASVYFMASTRR